MEAFIRRVLGDAPLDLMPQNTEEIQCKTSGLWQTPGRSAIHRSNKHLLTLSCQTADFTIYPKRLQEKKKNCPPDGSRKGDRESACNKFKTFIFISRHFWPFVKEVTPPWAELPTIEEILIHLGVTTWGKRKRDQNPT